MNSPTILLDARQWAEATFGKVQVGDVRRSRRVLAIAEALAQDPAGSLPKQLHDVAALEATYRLLHSSHVSYEQLLRPHVEQTRADMSHWSQVLLVQDTTEVDYQQHPQTTGLGPVGNGTHHGFLLQSVLAVHPDSRQVLGLAHQEPFLREPAPQGESDWQRQHREGESRVWDRSVQAIGSPPEGVQWIHVGDRGADIYRLLWLCQSLHTDLVVRAAQDRCVDQQGHQPEAPRPARSHHRRKNPPPAPEPLYLLSQARQWTASSERDLLLEATQKRAQRLAHLHLAWGVLRLLPPEGQGYVGGLRVWVVRVWEVDPPEGVQALEWILLTSVSIETVEHAWQRVDWYRCRWLDEDFHQGLKTGCHLEGRHLGDYEGLRTLLGMLSPLAVRLGQLRAAARQQPEHLASVVLPVEVVEVVAHLARREGATMTCQQCWHAIARYGGYLGRKGDGPPGWKTLWRGWMHIQAILEGVHLAPLLSRLNL